MPFYVPPEPPPIIRYDEHSRDQWVKQASWSRNLLYCDTTRQLVGNFQVGDVHYQLRQPLEAIYEPPIANKSGRFLVRQLLPDSIVGRGNDLEAAKLDWELKVDQKIQVLLSKQDFEKDEQGTVEWEILNRHFNLSEMRYSAPSSIRVYGSIEKIRGHIRQVRWLDGTVSRFRRHQIPSQMVTFRLGQPFEAVLKRDSRSWNAIEITAVFPAVTLPQLSAEEAEAIVDKIPSVKKRAELDF